MMDIEWDKIAIVVLTFALGMAIGHVQEARWSEIREKGLKAQIERQKCSDVNPYEGAPPHDSPRNSERPERES